MNAKVTRAPMVALNDDEVSSYAKELARVTAQVEGKDPKKIGQAVLAAFAKPRGPHKKRDKAAA